MSKLTSDTEQSDDPVEDRGASSPRTFSALIIASAPGLAPPRVVPIAAGFAALGRGAPTLVGIEDSKISRAHAQIRGGDGALFLEDLGSRNGTFVDGTRVAGKVALTQGSVIRVGDTLLVLASCSRAGHFDEGLVAISAQMAAVRATIANVAQDQSPVLITGETGTGKEVVARALHDESKVRGKLVTINCGALSEGLLASELFGHVRGAFTGASDSRDGLFKQADGGTLFLDEVGELPASLQTSFLRVLETGVVRPVGSNRDVPVNVRVVSATNRDLSRAMREGAFRKDLFARLAPWQIALPPLRERRADIPFLVHHLLERAGAGGRPLSVSLMQRLLLHPWPFNVRGLRNAVQVSLRGSPSGAPLELTPELEQLLQTDLSLGEPDSVASRPSEPPPAAPGPRASTAETLAPPVALPAITVQPDAQASLDERPAPPGAPPRVVLEALLTHHRGKVTEVAQRIGCKRQQLYAWLAHYQLKPESFRR